MTARIRPSTQTLKCISRPNALKALERLSADLYALVNRSPAPYEEQRIATAALSGALTAVEMLYSKR